MEFGRARGRHSPTRSRSPGSRSRSERESSAVRGRGGSLSWQQQQPATGGRGRSRSRSPSAARRLSRSRSPTPPPSRGAAAPGVPPAAGALSDAIADATVRLDSQRFRDVRGFFELVDKDMDNAITVRELKAALERLDLGLSRSDLQACNDICMGGTIQLAELERWLRTSQPRGAARKPSPRFVVDSDSSAKSDRRASAGGPRRQHKERAQWLARELSDPFVEKVFRSRSALASDFHRLDAKSTGSLTTAEVRQGLTQSLTMLTTAQARELRASLDRINEDDHARVDYDEFMAAILIRRNGALDSESDTDLTDDASDRRFSGASDTGRFSRHGLRAHDDVDELSDYVAELERQLQGLQDEVDDQADVYAGGGSATGGRARAEQLRNREKAGRMLGVRQGRTLGAVFAAWKKRVEHKRGKEARRLFAGQWSITGKDHAGRSVEEWLILCVGKSGDIQGECLESKPEHGMAPSQSSLEDGRVDLEECQLVFTQVYPKGDRTEWSLTASGISNELVGVWSGDAHGKFTARRCRIWAGSDESDVVVARTPRGIYDDGSSIARGSLKKMKTQARRLAHEVAEEVLEALARSRSTLASAFRRMDTNRTGSLSAAEFRRGIESLTGTVLTQAQMRVLMEELDRDGDDRVDYDEFVAAVQRTADARRLAREVSEMLRSDIRSHKDDLMLVFDEFDTNGDGVLSTKEFQRGLKRRGISVRSDEMEKLMQVVDTDGNSLIDYREFIDAVDRWSGWTSDETTRSPPKLTVRTDRLTDDDDVSPRSRIARQSPVRSAGTPAIISAIAHRLDDLDAWEDTHLFQQRSGSAARKAQTEAQELLKQLADGRDYTTEISNRVVARTEGPYTLVALLFMWLLRLPESPVPKTMFTDCKQVMDRRHLASKALPPLISDMPEPGQSIVRAVIELYQSVDPAAEDATAIDTALTPALMHSPQGAQPAWRYGEFISLLVQEMPRSKRSAISPRSRRNAAARARSVSPAAARSPRGRPVQSTRSRSPDMGDDHHARKKSPGAVESLFQSCPGRPAGGGTGRSQRRTTSYESM